MQNCIRCGIDINGMGVQVFVRTVGKTHFIPTNHMLCIEHGNNGKNVLNRVVYETLKAMRNNTLPDDVTIHILHISDAYYTVSVRHGDRESSRYTDLTEREATKVADYFADFYSDKEGTKVIRPEKKDA